MDNRIMFLLCLALICATILPNVIGYPDGSGVDGACSDLTPQHSNRASQISVAPYSIAFSPTTFTPGQGITVTLTSSGTGFKGFMIQARRADNQNQDWLGSFSTSPTTRQACSGKALVHSSKTVKSSLSFTWTAPSTSVGNITFRVTYLQSELVFWANRVSSVLVATDTPSSATTTTTATGSTTSVSSTAKSSSSSTKAASTLSTTTSFYNPNSASEIYSTYYQIFSLLVAFCFLTMR